MYNELKYLQERRRFIGLLYEHFREKYLIFPRWSVALDVREGIFPKTELKYFTIGEVRTVNPHTHKEENLLRFIVREDDVVFENDGKTWEFNGLRTPEVISMFENKMTVNKDVLSSIPDRDVIYYVDVLKDKGVLSVNAWTRYRAYKEAEEKVKKEIKQALIDIIRAAVVDFIEIENVRYGKHDIILVTKDFVQTKYGKEIRLEKMDRQTLERIVYEISK